MKRKYSKTLRDKQIIVLQGILENKPILFGRFWGSGITKVEIAEAWRRIATLAQSHGLVPDGDGDKFRRTTWQNWRRCSMAKVDRMKKTGVGGATILDVLDERDKLMLEILGEEIKFCPTDNESYGSGNEDLFDTTSVASASVLSSTTDTARPSTTEKTVGRALSEKDEDEKKLLKLTIYSKTLECREKEIKLGLPPSELTSSLYLNVDDSNYAINM